MAGSGGVENARYKVMLQSLQQHDPEIDHVVAYSKFVVVYLLHQDGPNPGWRKANIEGPVYLVRRRAVVGAGRFQLLVKSQFSTNDLLDDVHPDWELDCQKNYVFYKIEDTSQRIRGLWFHDDSERTKIEASLEKVLEEIRRGPPAGGPGFQGGQGGQMAGLGGQMAGLGGMDQHGMGQGLGAPGGQCQGFGRGGPPQGGPPQGLSGPGGGFGQGGPPQVLAGPGAPCGGFGQGPRGPMPADGSADALYAQFGLVRPQGGGPQGGPPGGATEQFGGQPSGWKAAPAPGQGASAQGPVMVTDASLRSAFRSLADDDFFIQAITQKLKEQAL